MNYNLEDRTIKFSDNFKQVQLSRLNLMILARFNKWFRRGRLNLQEGKLRISNKKTKNPLFRQIFWQNLT